MAVRPRPSVLTAYTGHSSFGTLHRPKMTRFPSSALASTGVDERCSERVRYLQLPVRMKNPQ